MWFDGPGVEAAARRRCLLQKMGRLRTRRTVQLAYTSCLGCGPGGQVNRTGRLGKQGISPHPATHEVRRPLMEECGRHYPVQRSSCQHGDFEWTVA